MLKLFDKDKLPTDNPKMTFLVAVIIFFIAGTGICLVSSDLSSIVFATVDIINNNNFSSSPSILHNSSYTFVEQKTVMSQPAPVRHPGQPSHEVVFALPLRDDGRIWSGTVTFTASKPIEAEILHTYNQQQPIDE